MRHFLLSFMGTIVGGNIFQNIGISTKELNNKEIVSKIKGDERWKDISDIVILGIYEFDSEEQSDKFWEK